MRTLERILTAIAVLLLPFVGLAAAAHQVEQGSRAAAYVYAAVAIIAIVELVRLSWHWHKQSRLHRAY
jgi:hypothetical protein